MPESQVVDEVVSRTPSRGTSRASIEESIDTGGGTVARTGGAEQETVREGGVTGRALSDSTKRLLAKLEAGKNAEDPDDEIVDTETVDGEPPEDPDDVGLEQKAAAPDPSKAETAPAAKPEEKPAAKPEEKPADEWQTKASRLEEHNRRLLSENEALRRAPQRELSAREKALLEAEQAYVDEGPVVAIRKFIATVLEAKHDSKDVDAELSGLYTDLTARELNVPLEQSQLALREAARARLALARDKRERKSQSEAAQQKPDVGSEQPSEQAVSYIQSGLTAKREGGTSFADEHPRLMALAEHLDGMSPAKLVAHVVKREIQIGNLDPKLPDDVLIRTAAQTIEQHYKALEDKFPRPVTSKPDTTTSGGNTQPATATTASTEPRQSQGAQTINNRTASVAPATSPRTQKAETQSEERPKFRSDKERREWALRHLPK